MDGWETRRRRTPGYDWCIMKLGLPGVIHGVIVDTSHFKGNFPEHCEIEACTVDGDPALAQLEDAHNAMEHAAPEVAASGRHSKSLSDFGLRSRHAPAPQNLSRRRRRAACASMAKLSRIGLRSRARASDRSCGRRARRLGDRFERHVFWLAQQSDPARPLDRNARRLGNAPAARARARLVHRAPRRSWDRAPRGRRHRPFQRQFPGKLLARSLRRAARPYRSQPRWTRFPGRKSCRRTKLKADSLHFYEKELLDAGEATHARFHIYPDGGVARLRIFGTVAKRPA